LKIEQSELEFMNLTSNCLSVQQNRLYNSIKLIGRSLLSINGFLKKIDEIEYQQQGEKIQLRS